MGLRWSRGLFLVGLDWAGIFWGGKDVGLLVLVVDVVL